MGLLAKQWNLFSQRVGQVLGGKNIKKSMNQDFAAFMLLADKEETIVPVTHRTPLNSPTSDLHRSVTDRCVPRSKNASWGPRRQIESSFHMGVGAVLGDTHFDSSLHQARGGLGHPTFAEGRDHRLCNPLASSEFVDQRPGPGRHRLVRVQVDKRCTGLQAKH